MAGFSERFKWRILDEVIGGTTFATAANHYLGLFTVAPTDSGGGTEVTTAGGTNYSRLAVANTTVQWSDASAGKVNRAALTFASAAAAWGTIVAVAAFDSSAGTSQIWNHALATAKTVGAGDVLRFDSGFISLGWVTSSG